MAKTPAPTKAAPSKAAPAKKATGGKKKNKKRTESYSTYIYRVLKQVHPDTGISKKGEFLVLLFAAQASIFLCSYFLTNHHLYWFATLHRNEHHEQFHQRHL